MRSLIIQYNIDISLYKAEGKSSSVQKTDHFIEKYSRKSFERYCKKYNHEYIRIEQPKINYCHPTWERIDLWLSASWCDEYDFVCYVDTDVFAMPWAGNIVEFCNPDCFNVVPQSWKAYRLYKSNDYQSMPFLEFSKKYFAEHWFQPGVFVITKKSRLAMLDIIRQFKDDRFTDDGILLNYALMKSPCEKWDLPLGFNVKWMNTPFPSGIAGINKKEIHFLHASGSCKKVNAMHYSLTTIFDN